MPEMLSSLKFLLCPPINIVASSTVTVALVGVRLDTDVLMLLTLNMPEGPNWDCKVSHCACVGCPSDVQSAFTACMSPFPAAVKNSCTVASGPAVGCFITVK